MSDSKIWLENNDSELTDQPPENYILTQRVLHFPLELVFEAWTNPELHKNWWGPTGFTNTFNVYDLRPGGKWSFVMHGPNKADYPNESVFVEITEQSKLVFNHISAPQFQGIATFGQAGEGTKLSYKMIFQTKEMCDKLRPLVVGANEENFDRLEAVLSGL